MLPKEYISPNQITTYLRCPMQYYYRYIENLIIPPRAALTRGKATHSGIEFNYRQKIETRADLPLNQVQEYTATEFENLQYETEWGEDNPGKVKDETINLVTLYHTEVAPRVQPVAVEKEINIEFENTDYTLKGYIDVVQEGGTIRDTKTVGRSPNGSEIQTNIQLVAYALAYRQEFGETEQGIALDFLVNNKSPKLVQMETFITNHRISQFLKILAHVTHAINNELFYPNPTCQLCSPNSCGYFQICMAGKEV